MTYSVTTSDIEARWRPLSDAESDVANTLIDDATTLIDVHRPALAAAVAAAKVPLRIVQMTIVEACLRVLINPDLLSNESVSADGSVQVGWQFQNKTPAPRMRLSTLDFMSIDVAIAAAGLGVGVAGSMRMVNSTPWTRAAAYKNHALDIDDVALESTLPTA